MTCNFNTGIKINLTIILLFILGFLFFVKDNDPQPGFLLCDPVCVHSICIPPELNNIIQTINQRNKKIRNFVCHDIQIKIDHHALFKLNAEIAYEKPHRFRMRTSSFLGLEGDLGSSDTEFWFWSRRMDPQALYYSDYDHISLSGLKTPFNPEWMMESLGLGDVDTRNALSFKQGNNWAISQQTQNLQGRPVIKMTIIDPIKLIALGHYLYQNDRLVASSECYETIEINGISVPSKMLIRWNEEDVTMTWTLSSQAVNVDISKETWEMPNLTPKIDMSRN